MIKKMLVLSLAFLLSLSGVSFAAGEVLSDSAMDGVSAGEWVIVKDSEGNESVADVYTVNNTLWLLEDSQKDIQAVSNANAVDSAVAVQANIASVTNDGTPTKNVGVNAANSANINNYRPSSSSSTTTTVATSSESASASSSGDSKSSSLALNASSVSTSSSSSSASSSAASSLNETLDIVGAAAGDSKEIGKDGISGGSFVATLLVDYDKVATAAAAAAASSASESSSTESLGIVESCETSSFSNSSSSSKETSETTTHSESRDSKGANNHIILDATSQSNIQAVSNLNAVGSGVAVQSNIASNVGVNGTISQSNSASVSSGF